MAKMRPRKGKQGNGNLCTGAAAEVCLPRACFPFPIEFKPESGKAATTQPLAVRCGQGLLSQPCERGQVDFPALQLGPRESATDGNTLIPDTGGGEGLQKRAVGAAAQISRGGSAVVESGESSLPVCYFEDTIRSSNFNFRRLESCSLSFSHYGLELFALGIKSFPFPSFPSYWFGVTLVWALEWIETSSLSMGDGSAHWESHW